MGGLSQNEIEPKQDGTRKSWRLQYRPPMIMIDGSAGERNFVVALLPDKKEE